MKLAPAIACAFALLSMCGLQAQSPAPWQAAIEAAPGASLQRVVLPVQVIANVKSRDAADLRVVDTQGLLVPFAVIEGLAPISPPTATRTRLPAMPIFDLKTEGSLQAGDGSYQLKIETQGGQTQVLLNHAPSHSPTKPLANQRIVGALFATQKLPDTVTAIELDINLPIGTPLEFHAHRSKDLKTWQLLGSTVLYKFNAEQQSTRIEFEPSALKDYFVRITWPQGMPSGEKLAIKQASFISQGMLTKPQDAALPTLVLTPLDTAQSHELSFRLPFAASIQSLHITLEPSNYLIPIQLLAKRLPMSPSKVTTKLGQIEWHEVARSVLYRLSSSTGIQTNPALVATGFADDREFKIIADGKTAGFHGKATLSVQFKPRSLVFLAAGSPPYSLHYGASQQTSVALPIQSLIPGYETGKEWELPIAKLVLASDAMALPSAQAVSPAQNATTTRAHWLWGILLMCLITLAGMVWVLVRKPQAHA